MCVLPALTYSCPTWTLMEKIYCKHNNKLRSILRVKQTDKIRTEMSEKKNPKF